MEFTVFFKINVVYYLSLQTGDVAKDPNFAHQQNSTGILSHLLEMD